MARFARVELQSNQGLQSSAGLWSTATLASSQTIIRSEKARRFDRRAGVPGWQWHEFRTREVFITLRPSSVDKEAWVAFEEQGNEKAKGL